MQTYTAHKVTQHRKHTRHATRRNVRANKRQQNKQSKFLLKREKHDIAQAAVVAQLIVDEAVEAGIVPAPPAVEAGVVPAAGGAGAALDPEYIMNLEVDLLQAHGIAYAVAGHATNAAPIQEQLNIQAEQVIRRGHGCSYKIALNALLLVLMSISVAVSTHYPMQTSLDKTSFLNSTGGYLGHAASAASLLSLDSAGIYTMCGLGAHALGAATRFVSSETGLYPLTPSEKKEVLFKLSEYAPSGPVSIYSQVKKYSGIAHLARDAYRKKKPVLSTIKESFLKSGINIDKNVAESLGMPRSDAVERPNLVTQKLFKDYTYIDPRIKRVGLGAAAALATAAVGYAQQKRLLATNVFHLENR
jgi:hypothetical protein